MGWEHGMEPSRERASWSVSALQLCGEKFESVESSRILDKESVISINSDHRGFSPLDDVHPVVLPVAHEAVVAGDLQENGLQPVLDGEGGGVGGFSEGLRSDQRTE